MYYTIASTKLNNKKILSTKTKFKDKFIYRINGLSEWFKYGNIYFKYNDILLFLGEDKTDDIETFAYVVEIKSKGIQFVDLLGIVSVYYNQQDSYKKLNVKNLNIYEPRHYVFSYFGGKIKKEIKRHNRLRQWYTYGNLMFRYKEVLKYFEIPYDRNTYTIEYFKDNIKELTIDDLIKIQVYFSQDDNKLYFKRLDELCCKI